MRWIMDPCTTPLLGVLCALAMGLDALALSSENARLRAALGASRKADPSAPRALYESLLAAAKWSVRLAYSVGLLMLLADAVSRR
jgi:hypothetical protein